MKKSIIVGTILMACSAFAAPVLEYDFSKKSNIWNCRKT